jgi:hypothetical protein
MVMVVCGGDSSSAWYVGNCIPMISKIFVCVMAPQNWGYITTTNFHGLFGRVKHCLDFSFVFSAPLPA